MNDELKTGAPELWEIQLERIAAARERYASYWEGFKDGEWQGKHLKLLDFGFLLFAGFAIGMVVAAIIQAAFHSPGGP